MLAKNHLADQESLQADVMRFMAIIALSLVAIMSLVSEAVPDLRPDDRDPITATEPIGQDSAPEATHGSAKPRPALPEILVPAPPRSVAAPVEAPQSTRTMHARPTSTIAARRVPKTLPPAERSNPDVGEVTPNPGPVERAPTPHSMVEPPTTPSTAAAPETAREPTESALSDARPDRVTEPRVPVAMMDEAPADEGLQLRFQSEKAFLRLVASGEIDVFAYRPGEVLHLNRRFALKPSRAPGEVYNLAVATVPATIRRGALDPSFEWAVALPAVTRRAIQGHIDRRASGVIEIQSSGAVRHVPSR